MVRTDRMVPIEDEDPRAPIYNIDDVVWIDMLNDGCYVKRVVIHSVEFEDGLGWIYSFLDDGAHSSACVMYDVMFQYQIHIGEIVDELTTV